MNPGDSETSYAYWTAPGNQVTVTYSLGAFHEIDFQVSEGFRQIPHGGIETGGVLFGRVEQEGSKLSVQVETFRTIECEHVSGPSFNLSERDLTGLRAQIAAAPSDSELQGLEALGWFVAHTRSPLEMNEREAVLFGQLFPGPGRMLLLVKPERFQATRFAFIVRGADGRVERDVTSSAIILPLPGRASRSSTGAVPGPAASIPAPAQSVPPVATPPVAGHTTRLTPEPPPRRTAEAPTAPVSQAAAPSFWRDVPVRPMSQEPVLSIKEPPTEGTVPELSSAPLYPPGALYPLDEIRRRRAELQASEMGGKAPITRQLRREDSPSVLRLVLILLIAAALGSGLGYFAYKQLPAVTIALTAQRQPAASGSPAAPGAQLYTVVAAWPPDETRDAIFAAIRVDDGEAAPLSTQQKAEGRAEVVVRGDNVKIELIAQRRWRDSRGIVRYVRAKSVER